MRRPREGFELHREAREVFLEALQRPANEVSPFLDLACAGDPGLRAEVLALLEYDREASSDLLDQTALGSGFSIPEAQDLLVDADATDGLAIPDRVGRYKILGTLGKGAMGIVYQARQEHTHRSVALKVLGVGAGSPRARERFRFEAEVLGLLKHPGIAQIYEAGTTDAAAGAHPFFAMELVEGVTITEHAEACGLGVRERLALIGRVAEAVHHAHQRGIVHRDLKPDNVLVDASGQPKVLDFGVAHLIDEPARGGAEAGRRLLVGTPAYMSPEQVTQESEPLDIRSDVYSLGVIAYQLLSGELPYPLEGASLIEVADHIRFHRPVPLGQRSSALGGDVEAIVAHALAKDRERRYASAADLAADVRRHLEDEPVTVRRLTVGYQISKFTRRNRALSGALLALALVLLGSMGTSTWLALRARSHSERALALNDLLLDVLTSPTAQTGEGFDVTVLEVLERSDDEMHSRLEGWPELQARLSLTLGVLYRRVGAFEAAERNLARSLSLYNEIEGENHATTLKAARVLLQVRVIHGEDPAQAGELLGWTLHQDKLIWGPESPEYLQTRHLQGLYQRRMGDLPEAVATLREVVSVGTRTQGPNSSMVSQARNFLARALGESGWTEEARTIAEETLSLQIALQGEEHRGTLISMVTLGELLLGEDDIESEPALLDRAREVLERAVAGRQLLLGEKHPGTLTARVHLARTRYRQGARAEGIEQLEQIVDELDLLYPPTQPEVREARAHLLELYRREGRASEATTLGHELERSTP